MTISSIDSYFYLLFINFSWIELQIQRSWYHVNGWFNNVYLYVRVLKFTRKCRYIVKEQVRKGGEQMRRFGVHSVSWGARRHLLTVQIICWVAQSYATCQSPKFNELFGRSGRRNAPDPSLKNSDLSSSFFNLNPLI